jgi:alpha-acetolactate decarboxylase
LNFFPEKIKTVSGEGFHLDISQKEKTYSGKLSPNTSILNEYRWSFIRETQIGECKRQKKR